jgi:hypothetical protein
MSDGWKEIEVPAGKFISWGKLGQEVTVKVFDFDPVGGKDFNGNVCPRLMGTLVDDADNYRDLRGDRTHERLKAGEMVTVEGGTANLKKGLLLCDPKRGDLVRLTYEDTYETAAGKGKVIKVQHKAGSGDSDEDAVSEDDI